jgi:hypothetical protein
MTALKQTLMSLTPRGHSVYNGAFENSRPELAQL